jgi:hypothetical protein
MEFEDPSRAMARDELEPALLLMRRPPILSLRRRPGLSLHPGWPQLVAVLDTNALANAACFEAKSGYESLVTRLIQTGRVPCFVADHVPREIEEHLPRIARTQGIAPASAFHVWETEIAPLLRIVELPIGEYLRPEIASIREPKRGDPDD